MSCRLERKEFLSDSKSCEQKMANSFEGEQVILLDHLCCKICYDPFSETGEKEPKALKCGHSICLQCVNMIYKRCV
jgi:hypothetical protein